jgi:hypothetical protein
MVWVLPELAGVRWGMASLPKAPPEAAGNEFDLSGKLGEGIEWEQKWWKVTSR